MAWGAARWVDVLKAVTDIGDPAGEDSNGLMFATNFDQNMAQNGQKIEIDLTNVTMVGDGAQNVMRPALDRCHILVHKHTLESFVTASYQQQQAILTLDGGKNWVVSPFTLVSEDVVITAHNFESLRTVIAAPPPTAPPTAAEDGLPMPSQFCDYDFKTFSDLCRLFEDGITPAGASVLPLCDWDEEKRDRAWRAKSSGSSGNFVNLLKTYIYVHLNWETRNEKGGKIPKTTARQTINAAARATLYAKYRNDDDDENKILDGTYYEFAVYCMQRNKLSEQL